LFVISEDVKNFEELLLYFSNHKAHLTLLCPAAFGDFQKKKSLTHMALRRNISAPVQRLWTWSKRQKTRQVF